MQNDKLKFKKEFKERLYRFVLKLIKLIEKLPKDRVCFILGDQLLRSGTSILSNYIEGQAASSKKDFIKYFEVSLKSINESKVWIALLRDAGKIKKDEAQWFLDELKEFGNIFASSILTLKGKKIK
jgi:four helix bundle protein